MEFKPTVAKGSRVIAEACAWSRVAGLLAAIYFSGALTYTINATVHGRRTLRMDDFSLDRAIQGISHSMVHIAGTIVLGLTVDLFACRQEGHLRRRIESGLLGFTLVALMLNWRDFQVARAGEKVFGWF
ncbi:MAG TPA: hypothetical protein VMF06_14270 [Candidatus Limnocylindria bacterium]|nr:hypothetical protein [Candidatus Limnocylindria bacterium]